MSTLQDHEARFFLFPASLLPEQVPADQKAQLKASAQDHQRVWMIHKHHNTCMAKNHAFMIHFYFYGMQVLWCHACPNPQEFTDVSTNLMLHSNPKFIHFHEIL